MSSIESLISVSSLKLIVFITGSNICRSLSCSSILFDKSSDFVFCILGYSIIPGKLLFSYTPLSNTLFVISDFISDFISNLLSDWTGLALFMTCFIFCFVFCFVFCFAFALFKRGVNKSTTFLFNSNIIKSLFSFFFITGLF